MVKCCDIKSGDLRQRIDIERSTKTPNGSGGFAYLWAPHMPNLRAAAKNLSGGERWQSQRVDANVKKRFTIRYRADILESDRIIFEGKAHNIVFLDDVEYRKQWLVIDAEAGIPIKGDG